MAADLTTIVSSGTRTVRISRGGPTVVIGERINPTGRKHLARTLQEGDLGGVRRDALAQQEAGAGVLDVNVGVPGVDEPVLMRQVVSAVMEVTDLPLSIDTANAAALEAALNVYVGKPLVNSVNGEEHSLERVLPLVKEHGAAVIGLCMDGSGIPATAEGRLAVAAKIIEEAAQRGIPTEDVMIDPLVLTLATDSMAGRVALETVRLVVREFGVNATMGASNSSFGLPDREAINTAFITLAIEAGVTCPIANPVCRGVMDAVRAADLLLGKDEGGARWIAAYRARRKASG